MKMPIRLTPPSVDRARARRWIGTTSVRYACRASPKMLDATPSRLSEAPRTTRFGASGAADHADRLDPAGHDQGVPLADPRGQRAGREVGDQLADPDQGEQEGGDADLGAERPRGEDDDGQDGAGADRAESGRTVGRERDAAQAPDRLDHLVTLRRPPDGARRSLCG